MPRLTVKEAAAYIPIPKSSLDKMRTAGGVTDGVEPLIWHV
jgi:hypothetical protein